VFNHSIKIQAFARSEVLFWMKSYQYSCEEKGIKCALLSTFFNGKALGCSWLISCLLSRVNITSKEAKSRLFGHKILIYYHSVRLCKGQKYKRRYRIGQVLKLSGRGLN
jgi:hypothetical protein